MASGPNMLKFIWGKGQGPSAERIKLQKQLFGFSKEINYGFPNKPSCIAWDPELKLLAIGAKSGRIMVYGRPGLEMEYQFEDETSFSRILFLPGQGRMVCVTSENNIHLLEIADAKIKLLKSYFLEGRLKSVSAVCLEANKKRLLLGTVGGNIFLLRLWNLSMEQEIIYQDQVIKNCPENFKVNPGSVEAILEYESNSNQILIGYTRGLVVLWDKSAQAPVKTFVSEQQLESLSWYGANKFASSHNDGSYILWNISTGDQEEPPNTQYGPYPCKSITKFYGNARGDDIWKIFSGGMPRASYGDKFTVTVMKNEDDHVALDLASKIMDFIVIEDEAGSPDSLLILCEEELVGLDLKEAGWPQFNLPYMHSMHASAITCISQTTNINNSIMEKLEKYRVSPSLISSRPWPVTGGSVENKADNANSLIITGHEDGSVKFWKQIGNVLQPFTFFKSSRFFKIDDLDVSDEGENPDDEEEEWPPFRKVGIFDPYSDDPRLAIKKVAFCGTSGTLVIGGTAGQVLVCHLDDAKEDKIAIAKAEIVTEKEGFTWKGHQPLIAKTGDLKMEDGWQPKTVLQISPPASITALVLNKAWGILAAGTAHGFVMLDYCFHHVITARSTLNAQDIANADDNPMSRRKSFKKSLRESFRRLRKGRSQRNNEKKKQVSASGQGEMIKREIRSDSPEARPVERQIEARGASVEDGLGSMVRCFHFVETFIANPSTASPTLWVGTSCGQVLVLLLNITPTDQRKNDKITAVLAKEIQLKHRAPVIDINVFDSGGLSVSGSDTEFPAPHKVLITSEEQFKTFLLPNLKPSGKFKLTAQEGARVRRVKPVTFKSVENSQHTENCIAYLTNLGEISILSYPELKRQVTTSAIRKEDVVGITSLIFTENGDSVHMSSSSEIQIQTVAANRIGRYKGNRGTVIVPPENRLNLDDPTDTDRQADLQNRHNEREAEQNGVQNRAPSRSTGEEVTAANLNNDTHNETTVSEASGDITLDSVKDHIVAQSVEMSTVETVSGTRTERVETVSHTVESVTVSRSQHVAVATASYAGSDAPMAPASQGSGATGNAPTNGESADRSED